jgi:hypothetical protein
MLRFSTSAAFCLTLPLFSSGCDSSPASATPVTSCIGADEACECPDGTESKQLCEDDAPLCDCAGEDKDSEQESEPEKETTKPPRDVLPSFDAGSVRSRDAATSAAGDAQGTATSANATKPSATESEGGQDSVTPSGSGKAPRIPAKPMSCPEIKTGTVTVNGQRVQLWVGAKKPGKQGPILFYWHGTGSTPTEATRFLGEGFKEIQEEGGVIASFTTSTGKGQNTGNNVWYTGDFEMTDALLACAIEQQDVDPYRVYTAGCSAGGLHASAMVYSRSSYLAAAMPNSGGNVVRVAAEDASHVPPVMATHGAPGRDVVVVDFSETTARQAKDLTSKEGFMVVCNHGGGHCGAPVEVQNAQWKFLKAHPFGVDPLPYAGGLPADFPSSCKISAK